MKLLLLLAFLVSALCEEVEYTCQPEPNYYAECLISKFGNVQGLFYSRADNRLYWTDASNSTVYRWTYNTNEISHHYLQELAGQNVTCIIPIVNTTDSFIICAGRTLVKLTVYSQNNYSLSEPIVTLDEGYYINKAHTDETHRIIYSTAYGDRYSGHDEQIYSIDNGKAPEEMLNVGRVIDFCIRKDQFWGVGHDFNCIHRFDYSIKWGILPGNQLIVLKSDKRITGVDVDDQHNLWYLREGNVFRWNTVNNYDNYSIPIPANNLTSITFAGQDLKDIIIGSSSESGTFGQQSGCIFRVTGMRGHGEPDYLTNVGE